MKFLATFAVPILSTLLMFTASWLLELKLFGQISTIFAAALLLATLLQFGMVQTVLSSGYNIQFLPQKAKSEIKCILTIGFGASLIAVLSNNLQAAAIILAALVVYLGKFCLLQKQLNENETAIALSFYIFHFLKIFIFTTILIFQINSSNSVSLIVLCVSLFFIGILSNQISFTTEDFTYNSAKRRLYFFTSLYSLGSNSLAQLGVFVIFGPSYAGVFAFFMMFYGGVSLYLNKFLIAKFNKSIVNPNYVDGENSHRKAFFHVKIGYLISVLCWGFVNLLLLLGFLEKFYAHWLTINILFLALVVRCYTAWQGAWGNRAEKISQKNKIQLMYLAFLIFSILLSWFLGEFIYFVILFLVSEVFLVFMYQKQILTDSSAETQL